MVYEKKANHKKDWINCMSCGRPIHKDRGCAICNPYDHEPKEPHYFVEDDILALQYHSLKKTGRVFVLSPPIYSVGGGGKNE